METRLYISLNDYSGRDFRIVNDQNLLNKWQGNVLAAGQADASGNIIADFELEEEGQIIVFVGASFFRCWVIPGKMLRIYEMSGIKIFEGDAAAINRYLHHAQLSQPLSIPSTLLTSFQPLDLDHFLRQIESKRIKLLDDLKQETLLTEKMQNYLSGEINGFTAFTKAQYPMNFVYNLKSISQKDVQLEYYDHWQSFRLVKDGHGGDMYMNALRDFVSYRALKENRFIDSDREKLFAAEFRITDSLLNNYPLTREKLKAIQLDFAIRYFNFDSLTQSLILNYTSDFPQSPYSTFLNDLWATKHNVLYKEVNFSLKDDAGKTVNLRDFRGKLIYIDFWGSWCKACIVQLPHSDQLQKKFAGRPVVFLFIDFYDDKDKWLSSIEKYKIGGTHLKAEKTDEDYFNKQFAIANGFPRYALVDPQGILRTISAPHPGDPSAANYLNSFLEK